MTRRAYIRLLLLFAFGTASCRKAPAGLKADSDVDYYTCTMHPSVHLTHPGKCPICSMDLVPVVKKGAAGAALDDGVKTPAALSGEFSVPEERQQQIGVTYAVVARKPLQHAIRSVGTVQPDLTRHWAFVARVDGFVRRLFVTSPGEVVEKNDPLLSIYSPDLLTTEREFVSLLCMRDEAPSRETREGPERLISAAKFRLAQWNITNEQIAALEKSRNPEEDLTLRSPFRGVVQEVAAHQGAGVKVGDHLVDVADLSVVWVWVDVYENELSVLRKGQKVEIGSKAYPGEKFEGEVALIDPFFDEARRTARARVDIGNADFKLRPGMYVNAVIRIDMGESLTIPVSAVMPTGERDVVFVDKGGGKLEPRIVRLTGKFGDVYGVESGLTEGERVVSSANFLIDAESKVQGALNSFEESK